MKIIMFVVVLFAAYVFVDAGDVTPSDWKLYQRTKAVDEKVKRIDDAIKKNQCTKAIKKIDDPYWKGEKRLYTIDGKVVRYTRDGGDFDFSNGDDYYYLNGKLLFVVFWESRFYGPSIRKKVYFENGIIFWVVTHVFTNYGDGRYEEKTECITTDKDMSDLIIDPKKDFQKNNIKFYLHSM